MLLSQTAEYALRASIVLARAEPGVYVDSGALSELANIPPAYAAKVMRRLSIAGLVQARRGVRGGFRLAKTPAEVRFLDVLLAVDPAEEGPARCAFGHPQCDAVHPCPMHDAYLALQGCFHRWAEHATLADLGEGVGRYLGAAPTTA